MHIKGLHLSNFKLFKDLHISLSEKKVTVLIGRNGTGKTSLLDAFAIGLGGFLSGFDEVKKTRHFEVEEARLQQFKAGHREAQFPVEITCKAEIAEDRTTEWTRSLSGKKGRTSRSKPNDILSFAEELEQSVRSGSSSVLPLLSYYGTGRLWSQKRDRKEGEVIDLFESGSRFLGYTNCLDPNSNEKLIHKWFKRMALIRFQEAQEPGSLTAVRKAVIGMLHRLDPDEPNNGVVNIDYNARTDEVETTLHDGTSLPVGLLSDGYRTLIGMIADIAYRMGTLNPHLGDQATQETPGVVLIDEIDLHLHPKWQRHVIRALTEIFPRVQFIVTTHSPFIIQSLEEEASLLVLEKATHDQGQYHISVKREHGEFYEMSVEDVTEYLMGIELPQWSERRQEMYEASKEYYELLRQMEQSQGSEEQLQQLREELDRLSKPFSKNVAFTAFLEQKRLITETKLKGKSDETR